MEETDRRRKVNWQEADQAIEDFRAFLNKAKKDMEAIKTREANLRRDIDALTDEIVDLKETGGKGRCKHEWVVYYPQGESIDADTGTMMDNYEIAKRILEKVNGEKPVTDIWAIVCKKCGSAFREGETKC